MKEVPSFLFDGDNNWWKIIKEVNSCRTKKKSLALKRDEHTHLAWRVKQTVTWPGPVSWRMGRKYSVTENWFVGNTLFERYLYSVGTTCITIGQTDQNTYSGPITKRNNCNIRTANIDHSWICRCGTICAYELWVQWQNWKCSLCICSGLLDKINITRLR